MRCDRPYRRKIPPGLWRLVRLPVLMLLVVLEPVVALGCATLALLGVLATLFFWFSAAPHFPAGTMLTISLAFVGALVLYEALIRVLMD